MERIEALPKEFFDNLRSGRFVYIAQGKLYNINLINHMIEFHKWGKIKTYKSQATLPTLHDQTHIVKKFGELGTVASHHHFFFPEGYWEQEVLLHKGAKWIS